jgi:hypothetical protein
MAGDSLQDWLGDRSKALITTPALDDMKGSQTLVPLDQLCSAQGLAGPGCGFNAFKHIQLITSGII